MSSITPIYLEAGSVIHATVTDGFCFVDTSYKPYLIDSF